MAHDNACDRVPQRGALTACECVSHQAWSVRAHGDTIEGDIRGSEGVKTGMTVEHEHDTGADAHFAATDVEPSIADAPTPDAQVQFVAETEAHARHTRIGWEVALGAAAVVLIGVGIAYALIGRGATADQPAEKPAASAPIPSQPATTDATASAATSPTLAGTGTPAPGAAPPDRTARPTERPAVAGVPLAELAAPPVTTVAMLVVPKGFNPATFGIVFQPYGWGPGGPDGGRIIVKISSSKPTNASATALDKDFAGRNAAVWCAPADVLVLVKGGTYTGVLTVRPQGDVGSLYLSDSKIVK